MADTQISPEVPTVIAHLDPDLEVPEPAKEPEEPKTCQLKRYHKYDSDNCYPCARPAAYQLSLKKPCGHVSDMFICQGCWNEIDQFPDTQWTCLRNGCKQGYTARKAIIRWEKL